MGNKKPRIAAASIGLGQDGIEPGGPAGMVSAGILAPIDYWHDESKRENDRAAALDSAFTKSSDINQSSTLSQVGDNAVGYAKHDIVPSTAASAVDAAKVTVTTTETSVTSVTAGGITAVSATQTTTASTLSTMSTETAVNATNATGVMISNTASEGVSMTVDETMEMAVKMGFSKPEFWSSFGIGLAGAAANAAINIHFNNEEDDLYKGAVHEAKRARDLNITFLKNLTRQNKKMLLAKTQ